MTILTGPTAPTLGDEEYYLINDLLSKRFGLNFPAYKRPMLEARLRPALQRLRLSSFRDYYLVLQYLPSGAGEEREMIHLVTNNETYFFRETTQFDALFASAAENPARTRLRILCAGCSSGEEPYSLAIYGSDQRYTSREWELTIDAFDLDSERVGIAKQANYGLHSVRGLEPDAIARYFISQAEERYQLLPAFREGVTVYEGNILDPSSFRRSAGYDALFCRNVLIYFSEAAVHKAVDHFATALRPGGLLFLGHSESIIGLSRLFEAVRIGSSIAYRRAS